MSSWRPSPHHWDDLPADLLAFWTARHLVTLTTPYPDGRPHVVPVGVTLDTDRRCAWVITSGASKKARNLLERPGSAVAACQVDGGRWSTVEGTATVHGDPETVAHAEARYAERYRVPRENPARVALRIEVTRILHSQRL